MNCLSFTTGITCSYVCLYAGDVTDETEQEITDHLEAADQGTTDKVKKAMLVEDETTESWFKSDLTDKTKQVTADKAADKAEQDTPGTNNEGWFKSGPSEKIEQVIPGKADQGTADKKGEALPLKKETTESWFKKVGPTDKAEQGTTDKPADQAADKAGKGTTENKEAMVDKGTTDTKQADRWVDVKEAKRRLDLIVSTVVVELLQSSRC